MANNTHRRRGGSFLSLLTLLFIGLKLGNVGVVATWSWWWVMSPLWIPLVVLTAFGVLAFFWLALDGVWKR